jgi:ABC-type polysaccharide/polyol phosphate transport system ATPase subunit
MNNVIECKNIYKAYHDIKGVSIKQLLGGKKPASANHGEEYRYTRNWALSNVSFTVAEGEAFGIIGANGSGKSTLLSLLLGVIKAQKGSVVVKGKIASLLELGAGFHFDLTGRDNIYLYGSILGMSIKEISAVYDKIVEFSELGAAISYPLRAYSSGMMARLGFSVIAYFQADVLLIDEVLAVGDAHFQEKCLKFLQSFCARQGTLVIVSHSMESVKEVCARGMCLNYGEIVSVGKVDKVINAYAKLVAQAEVQKAN